MEVEQERRIEKKELKTINQMLARENKTMSKANYNCTNAHRII